MECFIAKHSRYAPRQPHVACAHFVSTVGVSMTHFRISHRESKYGEIPNLPTSSRFHVR